MYFCAVSIFVPKWVDFQSREADGATIAELLAQERQINEERRSLDRRREQARLLARPGGTGALAVAAR